MSSAYAQVPLISTNDLSIFYAKLQDSLDASTKVKILKITAYLIRFEGDRSLEKRKYQYMPLERDIPEDNPSLYQIFLEESAQLSQSDLLNPKIQQLVNLIKKPYASQEVQLFLNLVKQNHLEEQQNPFSYLKDRVADGLFSVCEELPTAAIESVSIKVHFFKRDKPEEILTVTYVGKPSTEDL